MFDLETLAHKPELLLAVGDDMEIKEPDIKVEYITGSTFVTFNDMSILDGQQIDKLKALFIPIIEKNKKGKMVLNFLNVQSVSSAMLGLLLTIHKRVQEQEGKLELWNINKNIYKVFEITQLTKVFNILTK